MGGIYRGGHWREPTQSAFFAWNRQQQLEPTTLVQTEPSSSSRSARLKRMSSLTCLSHRWRSLACFCPITTAPFVGT